MTACWILPLRFSEIWIFLAFSIFQFNFNKYSTQWSMGHSGDGAVNKRISWKVWYTVYFIGLFSAEHKKIDAIFVQCPSNVFLFCFVFCFVLFWLFVCFVLFVCLFVCLFLVPWTIYYNMHILFFKKVLTILR